MVVIFKWQEDVYDTYKAYHITKQLEILWVNELIEIYICTIRDEKNDRKLAHTLIKLYYIIVNYKHETEYRLMIELIKEKIDECDSFIQLLMSEYILETIRDFHFETVEVKNVESALGILKSIAEKPVTKYEGIM